MVQRSPYTVSGLRDRVRGDLGLRGSNLITDDDVSNWANEAVREIADDMPWFRTSALIDAVADQATYDLPADLLSLIEVRHDGNPLSHVTERRLDGGETAWGSFWDWRGQASGTPQSFYILGATSIGLYPAPSANLTDGIEIIYSGEPTEPTSPTDTYQLPLGSDRAVVSYCLYRAALKASPGEGSDKVALYSREWQEGLVKARSKLADLMEGMATVVGGDARWQRSPGYWPLFDPSVTIPGP